MRTGNSNCTVLKRRGWSTRWRRAALCLVACGIVGSATAGGFKKFVERAGAILAPEKPTSQPPQPEPPAREPDRFCDDFHSTYTVVESVQNLASDEAVSRARTYLSGERSPQPDFDLMSADRVWIPVPFEMAFGRALAQRLDAEALSRGVESYKPLYQRVDAALERTRGQYPQDTPYEIKLYIVQDDAVNGHTLPGGVIIVTSGAASELSEAGLDLLLSHEMAHLTKRHLSKQFQQRLVETHQAARVFDRYAAKAHAADEIVFANEILNALGCTLATYAREQETEADACAARVLTTRGQDPLRAWDDFVLVRPHQSETTPPARRSACQRTVHPEDEARRQNLAVAFEHHRQQATVSGGPVKDSGQ